MPGKRKNKLSPEQLAQEAARKEIEAILNAELRIQNVELRKEKESGSVKKAGGISIRREEQKSPYVVDLKKTSLQKDVKGAEGSMPRRSRQDKFEQKLESLTVGMRSGLFKAKNFKKGLAGLKKALSKEREIQEEIAKGKKVLKAISKSSQELNRVETPAKIALRSFWLSRKLASVWKFYLADAVEYLEDIHDKYLRELLVVNVIALIGFIIFKIGQAIYKTLIYLGGSAWKVSRVAFFACLLPIFIGTVKQVFKQLLKPVWEISKYFMSSGKKVVNKMERGVNIVGQKTFNKVVQSSHDWHTWTAKQSAELADDVRPSPALREGAGRAKERGWAREMGSSWIQKIKAKVERLKSGDYLRFSLKFLPPLSWQRQLIAFAVIIFILGACFKIFTYIPIAKDVQGKVLGTSEEAINTLQLAVKSSGEWDFVKAVDEFSQAAGKFSQARKSLSIWGKLMKIAKIIPIQKLQVAAQSEELLKAGEEAAKIGEYLSLAFSSLRLEEESDIPLTKRLDEFLYYNKKALRELEHFAENINKINPNIFSTDIAEEIKKFQEDIPVFIKGLKETIRIGEAMKIFLGDEMDTRYLLIFQNNAEMRATGGFIGSFALVDFSQGEIKNIEVPGGGSYDLQGGLHKRILAPQPLHLINSLWEFQDANWWPDWPTSAKKIVWFFENGWGSSVDGVIAVTPTFVERLLSVIGPVALTAKYGTVIDENNFYEIVQSQAEEVRQGSKTQPNKPKEIIGDLAMLMAEELPMRITKDNFVNIVELVTKALEEKHILFNFENEVLQGLAEDYDWDGRVKELDSDYLMVVNTNIAGGKSDRKIKQTIFHQAEMLADGSIINTVTIKREHQAYPREPFVGVRNVNYLRVYVPKGSQLLEASGFSEPAPIYFDEPAQGAEIDPDIYLVENMAKVDAQSGVRVYSEFGKTVFAHWTQVDPGQTIETVFRYKLPFKIEWQGQNLYKYGSTQEGNKGKYLLYVQKQSGDVNTFLSTQAIIPEDMEIIWHNLPELAVRDNGWNASDSLDTDKYLGVILEIY